MFKQGVEENVELCTMLDREAKENNGRSKEIIETKPRTKDTARPALMFMLCSGSVKINHADNLLCSHIYDNLRSGIFDIGAVSRYVAKQAVFGVGTIYDFPLTMDLLVRN